MRLFLAITPPPDSRRRIFAAVEPLRAAAPNVAWVPEPLLHLTLKFLGEQPADAVTAIRAAIEDVVSRYRALALLVSGVGAFPDFRHARVIWMGAQPELALELLHRDIEGALEPLGFPVDARPFQAHLTLGRVRRPDRTALQYLSARADQIRFRHEVQVRSVDLMSSHRSRPGPRYRCVASAILGRV
ncbi:MAG TPA: RNA 2',3'-cyclic phosphodiesterase [Gemmatimonadaceae bacterium]|nr:RNA 2',3'-cyclic phosphodiesterase [Gemmatimonadaceae bacterium]